MAGGAFYVQKKSFQRILHDLLWLGLNRGALYGRLAAMLRWGDGIGGSGPMRGKKTVGIFYTLANRM